MKSATLLLIASAVFMLFVLHDKNKSGVWPSGANLDLTSILGKTASPAPKPASVPAKSLAPQHSAAPATPNSSDFLSSVLSIFRSGGPDATSLFPQKKHSRNQLRIARGLVRDELPNGLVLDCGGWVVQSATSPGVYAGDGRGMNAIYANLVVTHERLQFGRLMTVDHGALRESVYPPDMWVPESYLYGMAFLEGYPGSSPGRGKGLKVVAAPSGSIIWQGKSIPSYTASFTLSD